jgi:hypothetical protein
MQLIDSVHTRRIEDNGRIALLLVGHFVKTDTIFCTTTPT